MKLIVSLIAVLILVIAGAPAASATTHYVSQNGGGFSGGSACNGQNTMSGAAFNGSTLSPGDTVYLCGTIAIGITINSSGTDGNPINVKWDVGAKISLPWCNGNACLELGTQNWLVIDGGTPCGPGTPCSTTDASGIIEETANGTGMVHQVCTDHAIGLYGSNVEIKNLVIRNVYQRTSTSDHSCAGGDLAAIFNQHASNNNSIHDNTIHDMGTGYRGNSGPLTNLQFYRNNLYNFNWGFQQGTTGTQVQSFAIHDNHFGDMSKWNDIVANNYHHNSIILFNNAVHDGTMNPLYIYNNLFDGNPGFCTARIFFDGGQQTAWIYNNVVADSGNDPGNGPFTGGEDTANIFFYNNTIIGVGPGNPQQTNNNIQGHSTFENNVVTNLSALVHLQNSIWNGAAPTPVLYDYNAYGIGGNTSGGTGANWQWDGIGNFTTLSGWQSVLSGHGVSGAEAHSIWKASGAAPGLSMNSSGAPQSGSPLINAGANLSSLCVGNLAALCLDSSGGGIRTPTARPSSGPWTMGAFNVGGGGGPATPPPSRPSPPTNLGATIN